MNFKLFKCCYSLTVTPPCIKKVYKYQMITKNKLTTPRILGIRIELWNLKEKGEFVSFARRKRSFQEMESASNVQ